MNIIFSNRHRRVLGGVSRWRSYFNTTVRALKLSEDRTPLGELAKEAIAFCNELGLDDPLIEDSFLNAFDLLEAVYGRTKIDRYLDIAKTTFVSLRNGIGLDYAGFDITFLQSQYGYENFDIFFVAFVEYLAYLDKAIARQTFSINMPPEIMDRPLSRSVEIIDGVFVGQIKNRFGRRAKLVAQDYRELIMLSISLRIARAHEEATAKLLSSRTFQEFVLWLNRFREDKNFYFTWKKVINSALARTSPLSDIATDSLSPDINKAVEDSISQSSTRESHTGKSVAQALS